MPSNETILDTKSIDPSRLLKFQEMLQGNDFIDPQTAFRELGIQRTTDPLNPWSKADMSRLGPLDRLGHRFGIQTDTVKETLKADRDLAEIQHGYEALITKTNEEKRARMGGPTHGQVTEQGLASQVGVPFSYGREGQMQPPQQPTETLTPSASHPRAMQLGGTTNLPQYAVTPQSPLDSVQALKLHGVGQRLGAAPQQPNEAMFKEETRRRLIAGGMDPLVVDRTFASGGFEKEAAPGTDKARLDKARADEAQDAADIKHFERVDSVDKLFQAGKHGQLQNEKLRKEIDQMPENQDLKKRLGESLMKQRSETTKRLNGLAEAAKKIQMSKEDKLKVDTAIQQWKLWSAFNADTDISKEDMARGEAEILKAAGILTELSQRYPDLVKFMDVGAQHRILKGVGSPTGAKGPADLPPKSQAIYDRIMSQ